MPTVSIHRPHPTRDNDSDWDTINSTQLYRLYPHPPRTTAQSDNKSEKSTFASAVKLAAPPQQES